jgi:hypothetical protein
MKTTPRFEQAVSKLYAAFHNNTLNPGSCTQCAVGNILDNKDYWRHMTPQHGSLQLTYVGRVNHNLGKRFNGYTPLELLHIEKSFLEACGFQLPITGHSRLNQPLDKDVLFRGLEAIVNTLCKFDQLPNGMDCVKLFDYGVAHNQLIDLV